MEIVMRVLNSSRLIMVVVALTFTACKQPVTPDLSATESGRAFDVVFAGGSIVDGLGNAAFSGDIGIKGDRIVAISADGLNAADADVFVDIAGLVISPGFIDNHAHVQTTIHEHPLAENFIRQGITTIIASLHSGDQPWPLDEYAS
jgi:adenine deaminase